MIIRKYKPTDCECLAELFYHTVHAVNSRDYTDEQLNVWATGRVNLIEWNKSFAEHYTLVAVEGDIIVGFGEIDNTGYLDKLFVHKDYQNQGIATAICNYLELTFDVSRITTHASITAKTFFINRGYTVIKEQQVIRNGIALTNYVMVK